MVRLLLSYFLFCTTTTFAQFGETWQMLPTPPTPRVDDIFFVDQNNGWAAGGGSGNILKTTDGGDTWTVVKKSAFYLRSIEFLNSNIGFCGAFSTSGSAPFYKTIDGGETWTDISSKIQPQIPGICGL